MMMIGELVRDQVKLRVWGRACDQVRDQVRRQVCDQVRNQVWPQVRLQVWDQVRLQVLSQLTTQPARFARGRRGDDDDW